MLKKTIGTFIVKVIVALTSLGITIFLSRMLGAQGKGEASLIITDIAMLMLFCNMIGGASLIYLVPRYDAFPLAILSNTWSVIVCAISYIVLINTGFIPGIFVLHVCLLTLINSFVSTNLSILLGKKKIVANNFILLLQAVINFIIVIVLISGFKQNNTFSYIISLYVAMLLCFLISSFMIFPFIKNISFQGSKKIVRELIRLGVTNQLGHIMSFLSFRLSYFLLSNYCGNAGVGVYSNGTSLIESILLISNSITTVLYPTVANTADKHYSRELTTRLIRISILFCLLALTTLLILPPSFFVWLFGNEFRDVKNVIARLAPGIFFYNIALIAGHYFSGTGKYWINSLASGMGLLITIVLSGIFLSSYSINTAAIITSFAYITITFTILYYFLREAKISFLKLLPVTSDLKWLRQKAEEFVITRK